jgi:hypothetical protein
MEVLTIEDSFRSEMCQKLRDALESGVGTDISFLVGRDDKEAQVK